MNSINYHINLASKGNHIIPGFNVFGYEDAQAVILAAERLNSPVLLMINSDACRVMDVKHWGALLTSLANSACVPVGVHLDHCSDSSLIFKAVDSGFTSVMYDGSKLPLVENISNTNEIASYAHKYKVAVEAEVGSVPYSDNKDDCVLLTLPEDVERMVREGDTDWLAVSIGNIHRQTVRKTRIDFDLLSRIEELCSIPLVLHGASGVMKEDVIRLRNTSIGKVNIGTALRLAFGDSLRKTIMTYPETFDRIALMESSCAQMENTAYKFIKILIEQ